MSNPLADPLWIGYMPRMLYCDKHWGSGKRKNETNKTINRTQKPLEKSSQHGHEQANVDSSSGC
eukprot:8837954-Pyramimonas_sp.AAC.1